MLHTNHHLSYCSYIIFAPIVKDPNAAFTVNKASLTINRFNVYTQLSDSTKVAEVVRSTYNSGFTTSLTNVFLKVQGRVIFYSVTLIDFPKS